MVVLIDPPTWPAHGTVFSHLVSDTSLGELHAFAVAHGVSQRAFDLDHYDVPANLYRQLLDGGAQAVSGSELTRRLAASGLRVPLKERPAKIRKNLLARWDALAPSAPRLGQEVLGRWQEPHRAYHNSAHLLEMLTHLSQLSGGVLPRAVLLATWLHDIVYTGSPGEDERASADFARQQLPAHRVSSASEAETVADLIEATVDHGAPRPSANLVKAGVSAEHITLFLDADLAILAADQPRYRRYAAGVRSEYARFSDAEFSAGRATVLEGLLARPFIFSSPAAQQQFEAAARANIARELAQLTGRSL